MKKHLFFLLLLLIVNNLLSQSFYQVTTDILNVRNSASKEGQVICKFHLGDSICVIDYSSNWSKVKINDSTSGFVSSKYLSSEFKTTFSNKKNDTTKEKSSSWIGLVSLIVFVLLGWYLRDKKGNSSSSSKTVTSKVNHWFLCKNCEVKIKAANRPTSLNCSRATFHNWTDLGKVGDKNYNCKNCGVTVWTKDRPTSLNCSSATFHNWTQL